MARKVRDRELDSPAARSKLKASPKPYWRALGKDLHVGYRKGKRGATWVVRMYQGGGDYKVEAIGAANDAEDADGARVLDFWQAAEKARAYRAAADDAAASRAPSRYTVGMALDDYLEWLDHNRRTGADARWRADALIQPELGKVEVSKLTTDKIRAWLNKVAETPPRLRVKKGEDQRFQELQNTAEAKRRRRATANRTLTILKAALNHAWRDGKVPSDAAWRVVKPFERVDAARIRYLAIPEAQRLVNASDLDFRPMVQAALQTGARYSELAALRVADFNPDVGTVTIRDSKTGKARHVVLTEEGVELFGQLSVGRGGHELLLRNEGRRERDATGADEGEWRKSDQVRPMAAACERAKITPPIGFHGLRHTWASLAVMAGVPLMVVARNLGHADTRMVEKHYGHLSPSYVADAIRAGAPRFGTVAPSNVEQIAGAGR